MRFAKIFKMKVQFFLLSLFFININFCQEVNKSKYVYSDFSNSENGHHIFIGLTYTVETTKNICYIYVDDFLNKKDNINYTNTGSSEILIYKKRAFYDKDINQCFFYKRNNFKLVNSDSTKYHNSNTKKYVNEDSTIIIYTSSKILTNIQPCLFTDQPFSEGIFKVINRKSNFSLTLVETKKSKSSIRFQSKIKKISTINCKPKIITSPFFE